MKKFLTLTALVLLSGCSTPIQVDNLNSQPPLFQPAMPAQIVTVPVKWTVLTQKQIQLLAQQNNPNVVYYSLDPNNFQNLAVNLAEIQRYIQDEKIVILAYGQYYGGLMAQKNMTNK